MVHGHAHCRTFVALRLEWMCVWGGSAGDAGVILLTVAALEPPHLWTSRWYMWSCLCATTDIFENI